MRTKRRWILCIDPDESRLRVIYQALPRYTFPVTWAEDVAEARERLDRIRFDLVILHEELPEPAGEEPMLDTLGRHYPRVPLIVVTTGTSAVPSAHPFSMTIPDGSLATALRPAVEQMLSRAEAAHDKAPPGLDILALERSESLFPVLFTTMNDGCLMIDTDGVILVANEAAARIFSLPHESLLGRQAGRMLDPATRARLHEFEREAARAPGPISRRFEGRVRLEEEGAPPLHRPVLVSIRSHFSRLDRFDACVVVLTDIEELTETRETLRMRVAAMERFQRFFLERETRVVELKARIRALEERLGIDSPGLSAETRTEMERRIRARGVTL